MRKEMDADGIELIRRAIVVQAAKDYRQALRTLKKNPNSYRAKDTKEECERFFQSGEFIMLFENIDGEYLIRKLREEVNGK